MRATPRGMPSTRRPNPRRAGPSDLPRVLERALNHVPSGLGLVLMRAVDAHPSEGIAMVGGVDRSELTVDGLDLLLRAQTIVDRRHRAAARPRGAESCPARRRRDGEGPTNAEAVTHRPGQPGHRTTSGG